MGTQVMVLTAIAVLMTIGVYGLVAAIVKLDDAGIHLLEQPGRAKKALGGFILRLAPKLMKSLSVLGTAAMFLVGGGILVHGLPPLADVLYYLEDAVRGRLLGVIAAVVFNGIVGFIAGGIVVGVQTLISRNFGGRSEADTGH